MTAGRVDGRANTLFRDAGQLGFFMQRFLLENNEGLAAGLHGQGVGTNRLRAGGAFPDADIFPFGAGDMTEKFMVASAVRGQGVGQAMCEHSLAEARRLGFRAMQYNLVVAGNESARRLWTRMGFEDIGVLPGAFHHSELGYVDAIVMYREL